MAHKITDSRTIAKAAHAELKKNSPEWSVDELLLHPAIAIQICRDVRRKLNKKLEDDEILRSLLNGRKQGILKD